VPHRTFAFLLLLLGLSSPAAAATKSYHVTGRVLYVLAGLGGDHTGSLAALGVTAGATVQVDYTLELSTPGVFGSADQTNYDGAITAFQFQIGSWTASRTNPVVANQNLVSVSDTNSADILFLTTPGEDTSHIMEGDPNLPDPTLSLQFTGGANVSNGQALDQNPNKYSTLVGAATGTYAQVYFEFKPGAGGGGGHTQDPKAGCHTARLNAAASLCQAKFQCLAKRAKAPDKDPLSDVLHACTAKADAKFLTSFDKAGVTAAKKGLQCPLSVSGEVARQVITNLVAFSAAHVDALTPATPPVNSAWLSGAAVACSAGLKAEARDAAKPDAQKLATARQKADDKLTTAASNAVAKAAKKGVVFVPDADVPGFVGSVDDAIDGATDALADN